MSTEELQELQAERAKEFGIEALAAPRPQHRGWPRKFFGLRRPHEHRPTLAPSQKLKSARARFKKVADRYKTEVEARRSHAHRPAHAPRARCPSTRRTSSTCFVPGDPSWLTKKSFDGALVFELRALTDLDLKVRAEGEACCRLLRGGGNVDLTQFGRGPATRSTARRFRTSATGWCPATRRFCSITSTTSRSGAFLKTGSSPTTRTASQASRCPHD